MAIWKKIPLRNQTIALLHDLGWIPICWLGAFWLRFNLESIPVASIEMALAALPFVFIMQGAAFWHFGLYRGVWRFASLPDLMRIIKAVSVGSLLIVLTLFFFTRLQAIPRSVMPLYGILLVATLGGSRFAYRWLKDTHRLPLQGARVLIIGAGRAGESLVRDLIRNQAHDYSPIAFLDDQEKNLGRDIYGVPIIGKTHEIVSIVDKLGIDVILIALPSAKASDMRRIVALCEKTSASVRTLPAVSDIMSGRISLQQLRPVGLDDLLGRDPVSLDWKKIKGALNNKVVLVSGGGGSIGSELCRQLMQQSPQKLIVIDNSEYHLFQLERQLTAFPEAEQISLHFRLVDVSDKVALEKTLRRYRPQVIYHAAAYKHVPILESQIREAMRINVMGTYYLSRYAMAFGVERFVLVSTDKAVNPTNIMGATKRIAEQICQHLHKNGATRFITVRFGNVLGSRGSVVEIFQEQLSKGGPITITHPDVTRYFMTIPEAAQLILQASVMGEGGEIFMLDMGEAVKIRYLAEQMIRLAGKRVGEDIQIQYVGMRPGEKLVEELFHEKEALAATGHPKILKARSREDDKLNDHYVATIEGAMQRFDEAVLLECLTYLVPEFSGTTKRPLQQKVT